ncbi:hypothetical protein HMSP1_43 [Sinorhizobium phage HMSP1-Susan]|nr:hypothetical protein HMSP1_43 [Sinorhizobium phage HMSP1-Susan]
MAFPTRLQELLAEGRIVIRSGITLEFGTGTYRYCTGKNDIVGPDGTYKPNSLIEIEDTAEGLGMAAAPLKIRLPARADFGLTPDVLANIENEDYKNRPVTMYDFYIDPDTRALLHTEPRFTGYVDTIDHVQDGPDFRLEANIETRALDNHRNGYRTASSEDQQQVSAGDKFFDHAASTRHEYFDIEL